jgi:hypothetical protein
MGLGAGWLAVAVGGGDFGLDLPPPELVAKTAMTITPLSKAVATKARRCR